MKYKILSLLLLGMFLLVGGISEVSAVECNATISNQQSCTISTNLQLTKNTYLYNGSGTSSYEGVMNITSSNIIIDLNGSTIMGNWTNTILGSGIGSRTAFNFANVRNVTIKNGYISNYENGFTQLSTLSSSIENIFINITFTNNDYGVRLFRGGMRFYNNTFINHYQDAIRLEGATASSGIIINNIFIGGADQVSLSSTNDNSGNHTIVNNSFTASEYKYGIILSRSNSNLIQNNYFSGVSTPIGLTGLGSNNIIQNNYFENVSNFTKNYPLCTTCFAISQYSEVGAEDNLTIYNNTFVNIRSALTFANLTSANILNNNFINITSRSIRIFLDGNLTFQNNYLNNVTDIQFFSGEADTRSLFRSEYANYTIINTQFSNMYNMYEFGHNSTNVTLYGSYPTYLVLNNSQTISSVFSYIKVNSLTNSLIYNLNGTIYGSNNINSNDGLINVILPAKNITYLLDNFNLTEGISRQYSPLWFSQSSSTEKHIASNLSDTINDVTVIINVDSCDNVGKITYRSNTGTYSATYNRNDYTCSNNQVTLTIDGIEPSLNSNELNIEYGCSSTTRSGYMLVMIFASLIIFWFMGNFAWQSYQEGNLTVGKLIMVFVIIVVCLALWTASGQNLGSSCGVVG